MLLAALLVSVGMSGAHAEAAGNAISAPAAGHCADMPAADHGTRHDGTPSSSIDCMIACACVPAQFGPVLNAGPLFGILPHRPQPLLVREGLNPAADPPPPRLG